MLDGAGTRVQEPSANGAAPSQLSRELENPLRSLSFVPSDGNVALIQAGLQGAAFAAGLHTKIFSFIKPHAKLKCAANNSTRAAAKFSLNFSARAPGNTEVRKEAHFL